MLPGDAVFLVAVCALSLAVVAGVSLAEGRVAQGVVALILLVVMALVSSSPEAALEAVKSVPTHNPRFAPST